MAESGVCRTTHCDMGLLYVYVLGSCLLDVCVYEEKQAQVDFNDGLRFNRLKKDMLQ